MRVLTCREAVTRVVREGQVSVGSVAGVAWVGAAPGRQPPEPGQGMEGLESLALPHHRASHAVESRVL